LGSVSRRLVRLEERAKETTENEEELIGRDALRRVTDEDLRLLHAFLKRAVEGSAVPTEAEEAALGRYEELKAEVRNEYRKTFGEARGQDDGGRDPVDTGVRPCLPQAPGEPSAPGGRGAADTANARRGALRARDGERPRVACLLGEDRRANTGV
jgi:hypothetical protein